MQDHIPDFIQRGKVLIVRRQFQEAVKVCRLGLLAHPGYVEGRLVLGMALMALGRHDEVLAEMRVAMELDADNPMAHLLKGEALFHKRDYEQARDVLARAQELDPLNEKVGKLVEDVEDVLFYGHEPGPRAKTETKVYPAQRGDEDAFEEEPSDVLGRAVSLDELVGEVDADADELSTACGGPALVAPVPEPGAAVPRGMSQYLARLRDEPAEDGPPVDYSEIDEEYTTAPFLPPTHMAGRLHRLQDPDAWMESTVREDEPELGDQTDFSQIGPLPAPGERRPEDPTEESSVEVEWSPGGTDPAAPVDAPDGPSRVVRMMPEPGFTAGDVDDLSRPGFGRQDEDEQTERDPFVGEVGASGVEFDRFAARPEPFPTGAEQQRAPVDGAWPPEAAPPARARQEITEPPEETERSQLDDDPRWGEGWQDGDQAPSPFASDVSLPVTADGESEAMEEEPTLVPGEVRQDEPEPLHEVGTYSLDAAADELPTLLPGEVEDDATVRTGADDEDDDTVVNADAPPPEALFGEEEVPAVEPSVSRWDYEAVPRAPTDETRALAVDEGELPVGDTPMPPSVSEVQYSSGVEELQARESARLVLGEDGDAPALGGAQDPRLAGLAVEEIPSSEVEIDEDGTHEISAPELLSGPRDLEPVPDTPHDPDLSEISIEMLPDDLVQEASDPGLIPAPPVGGEVAMPPLPPDARGDSSYDASMSRSPAVPGMPPIPDSAVVPAPGPAQPSPVEVPQFEPGASLDDGLGEAAPGGGGLEGPVLQEGGFDALPDSGFEQREESQQSLTRVKFDVPDDQPPEQLAEPADALHASYPADLHAEVGPEAVDPLPPYPDLFPEQHMDPYADPYLGEGPPGAPDARGEIDPYGQFAPGSPVAGHVAPYPDEPAPPDDPLAPAAPPGAVGQPARPVEDSFEINLEPAEEEPRWPSAQRTAALEEDGRELPYLDDQPRDEHPTSETRPGGPAGLRAVDRRSQRPRRSARASGAGEDDLLQQMTGDVSGLFKQRAPTQSKGSVKPGRRRDGGAERTATSWITILVGEPGSHRWVYLLLSALGVLALAVAIGLAVRYYRLGEQIDAKRTIAETRLRAGNLPDYMAAISAYADILARRPDDADARWTHARIQAAVPFEFGDPIPQESRHSGADGDAGDERAAADIYANLYSGSLERAANLVLKSREHHPESPLLPYLDGRISLLRGNPATAARHFQESLKRDGKNPLVLRAMGDALAAQGRMKEAIASYDKALALNSDHVASRLGRARVLLQTRQRTAEVKADLRDIVFGERESLASRGQRGWGSLLLARLALQSGKLKQARQKIRQASSNVPSRDAPFQDELAALLIDTFQLGEAHKAIRESKRIMSGRPHPHYQMARIHLRQGQPRAALAELKHAHGLQHAESRLLRARIYLQLGELARAKEEVEHVLGVSGAMLGAHVVKAKVLAAQGHGEKAESALASLLSRHPTNSRVLTAYGEVLLSRGKVRAARDKLNEALRHDPHAYRARLRLAEVLMKSGKYREARRSLQDASRANYGNVQILMQLAAIDFHLGDLGEAATNLQAAHKRAPNDWKIMLELARVYTVRRQFDKARAQLKNADARSAPKAELLLARGRLALARGKAQEAVRKLKAASRRTPKKLEVWSLLVQALLAAEDLTGADAAVDKMAREFSEEPETEAARGRVAVYRGQLGTAKRHFGRAVSRLRSSSRPPRQRAALLLPLGRAQQDAGELAIAAGTYEQAIKACPSCPAPHHRAGLVQDEGGYIEEAMRSFRKARKLDPRFMDTYWDLAQCHERQNRIRDAIKSYKTYLSLEPPRELADAAREALDALRSR